MSLPVYSPMLATPWSEPFDDAEWLFEVKWDGVRALIASDAGRLTVRSRRGNEVSATYPELAALQLADSVVVDGEIVAMDDEGRPSFQRLQGRMNLAGRRKTVEAMKLAPVHFLAFDLLYEREPLIGAPLVERRRRLESRTWPDPMVVSAVVPEHGNALFEATVGQGLEGIVAKRAGSTYRPGVRSPDWRKVPHHRRARMIVMGFTPGERRRATTFGALVLGLWSGDTLRFVGSVGTGFTDRMLGEIRTALDRLTREGAPFDPSDPPPATTHFVEPVLVAEVEFKQWTAAGHLRAPSFKGWSDTRPEDVTWEAEGPPGGGRAQSDRRR